MVTKLSSAENNATNDFKNTGTRVGREKNVTTKKHKSAKHTVKDILNNESIDSHPELNQRNLSNSKLTKCYNCKEKFRDIQEHFKEVLVCRQAARIESTNQKPKEENTFSLEELQRKKHIFTPSESVRKVDLTENIRKVCPTENVNSFKILDNLEECNSCRKEFKNLFSHLKRSKMCQTNYDMDVLEREKKEKRRIYVKESKQDERRDKREKDEVQFKKFHKEIKGPHVFFTYKSCWGTMKLLALLP